MARAHRLVIDVADCTALPLSADFLFLPIAPLGGKVEVTGLCCLHPCVRACVRPIGGARQQVGLQVEGSERTMALIARSVLSLVSALDLARVPTLRCASAGYGEGWPVLLLRVAEGVRVGMGRTHVLRSSCTCSTCSCWGRTSSSTLTSAC